MSPVTARRNENGVYEPIFCDRIEIPMRLFIDVTDQPDDLTEETADVLRRCCSEDEAERALAQEDLLMAFIMDTPAACAMSCGGDSADAIENLQQIGALSAEPSENITSDAAWARRKKKYQREQAEREGSDGPESTA